MSASRDTQIDPGVLITDLRIASQYAARIGLITDSNILTVIRDAEDALASGSRQNVEAILRTLSEITKLIAPITIADLKFGRDPFSPLNQRKSKISQFILTFFALIVLGLIGTFMQWIRLEQASLQELKQVQQSQPQLRLTQLRKMAQFDEPVKKQNAIYDEFHRKVDELRQLNSQLYVAYNDALEASNLPLYPLEGIFSSPGFLIAAKPAEAQPASSSASSGRVESVPSSASNSARHGKIKPITSAVKAVMSIPVDDFKGVESESKSKEAKDFCVKGSDGEIQLPPEAFGYPGWMKAVLADVVSDFCFQLKVLYPDGQGALMNQSMGQLGFVSHIKEKVAWRVEWFLPFLYGLLGSTVFVMRNITSVRTPAQEWLPILMRLCLGGVAGIIVGWFSAANANLDITTTLSIPFALAFLTGYGIDVMFSTLDRLNRAIGDTPKAQ